MTVVEFEQYVKWWRKISNVEPLEHDDYEIMSDKWWDLTINERNSVLEVFGEHWPKQCTPNTPRS